MYRITCTRDLILALVEVFVAALATAATMRKLAANIAAIARQHTAGQSCLVRTEPMADWRLAKTAAR